MSKEQVPLKYARSMLRVAGEQGYNVDELVLALSLPVDPFDESDPEATISASLYSKIYNRVMWLLQDESFGLSLKHKSPTGTFRMMSLSSIHCQNLEQAIRRGAEFTAFCQSLSGMPSVYTNPIRRLDDNTAEYRFPSSGDFLDISVDPLAGLAHCVAIWRRFCSWLIGKHIELIEVCFELPEPSQLQRLNQLFNCKLRFNQEHNSFRFASSYLQAPLVHTEESLKEFLRNAPYHLLASAEEDDNSILAQMRRIIGNDFSRDFLSVVEMANELNMSVRTLRRRLKDLDTTYQQFKDNLRRDAAMGYLNRPELKINAVSALLGFDEPSAFHRSFKKWTGMTPGEYRRQPNGSW